MAKHTRKRAPKLKYTENRGIGWHCSFRDPVTGTPMKHRFGMIPEAEARVQYHKWVAQHLNGETASTSNRTKRAPRIPVTTSGLSSLIEIASAYVDHEELRARRPGEPRRRGTIDFEVFQDRKYQVHEFLKHLNTRHGQGAAARMLISDISMDDIEDYNRQIVAKGYSDSQVKKRMQIVRAFINRGGRPEHGHQVLAWNWDSRDRFHGRPAEKRALPTKGEIESLLQASTLRERAMIWIGIGLGFGQRDIASLRVGQIDEKSYDLRRVKTGVDRFGETPPLVWAYLKSYLQEYPRENGALLFTTMNGMPVVHGQCDSIAQWWRKKRTALKLDASRMKGFYVLRHLGATEFGSRPKCSIGEMKRWLGHSASSRVADVYMKPVSPESREAVEWVRKRLRSRRLDAFD